MLDPHDVKWSRFISGNARVLDAAAELQQEQLERPWATEEKRIFMDKFLLYPKVRRPAQTQLGSRHIWCFCFPEHVHCLQIVARAALQEFHRIAAHLDRRSTADCVTFYYRIQKEDEFAVVRRKMQLKKRRQQSEYNRAYSFMGMGLRPVDAAAALPAGALQLPAPADLDLEPCMCPSYLSH